MTGGLKHSIVIVNEYTRSTGKGRGTRGGTPGDYVTRYMARNLATETATPVRLHDTEEYITRYMARKEASEELDSVPQMKHRMHQAQKDGGVAFGYGDVSLSDEKLKQASEDIQWQFDHGKTVFKTVLSFDEEYLREHGLIDEEFEFKKRGDYRGHIDQLKLRLGIMHGLSRLSRKFDDLQYVGVIQVDTAHVHCHLAMVDRGKGHVSKDGRQTGILSTKDKRTLRHGMDCFFDQNQEVRMLSSSVLYDKRNALCYIKRFTHRMMSQQGVPQFLVACLPSDRQLWHAGSNSPDMRKPNAIVREFVTQILGEPGSGYHTAMRDIGQYADTRQQREDLSDEERQKLVDDGQERLIRDCMNGVYSILSRIPSEEMQIRTPMLSAMAMDYEEMAAVASDSPMVEFGFKLRSYSSRLKHHREEYHKYRDELERYENTPDKSEDSQAVADFFQIEMEYNQMLMVKYQYFLSFLPPDLDVEEMFNKLMDRRVTISQLQRMRSDPAFKRMSPDIAEDYGLKTYGQHGGRRMRDLPGVIDERIKRQQDLLEQETERFTETLHDYGLDYERGHGISRNKIYSFDDVKALDLHHLGYDFSFDAEVSRRNVDHFCNMARRRYEAYRGARQYLIRSGQSEVLSKLPERDILFMQEYSDHIRRTQVIQSERPENGTMKPARTVPLGSEYMRDMQFAVSATVRAASEEYMSR